MFDITFLGASGGPLEQGTCSILLKPHHKSYGELIAGDTLQQELLLVDAGSGLSQLTDIIYNEQNYGMPYCRVLKYYDDAQPVASYVDKELITPFSELQMNPFRAAQKILSSARNCLVTHPHMDHVASLVINSPFFEESRSSRPTSTSPELVPSLNVVDSPNKPSNEKLASSHAQPNESTRSPHPTTSTDLPRASKRVFGSKYTVDALKTHLFNDIIWPRLPLLHFQTIEFNKKLRLPEGSKYEVVMFPLSHGRVGTGETVCNYLSSAFLVSYTGDVKYSERTKRNKKTCNFLNSSSVSVLSSTIGTLAAPLTSSETPSSKGSLATPSTNDSCATPSPTPSIGALVTATDPNSGICSSSSSILIFGDFESDSISSFDYNLNIWKYIAPLILSGELRTIVLECSNASNIKQEELYGHLNPGHLISELKRLRTQCQILRPSLEQPLSQVSVIVTHVKEHIAMDSPLKEPRRVVLRELEELVKKENLQLSLSIALSGVTIVS